RFRPWQCPLSQIDRAREFCSPALPFSASGTKALSSHKIAKVERVVSWLAVALAEAAQRVGNGDGPPSGRWSAARGHAGSNIVFGEADPPAVDTTAATTLRSCSTQHEISQSRDYFHSRHGDSRHPGDGFDHPRPAEVDSRFSWRRNDGRGEVERAFRSGLRTDAVFLFTFARSFVRSIWKTADHPALKSRSRIGLHRDGDGAHVELAFSRPNYFGNHDFKHSHRDGLHRRRYAERKTSWSVRADRRGIRRRIHIRASNWWIGWRRQSASRVLDCSRA